MMKAVRLLSRFLVAMAAAVPLAMVAPWPEVTRAEEPIAEAGRAESVAIADADAIRDLIAKYARSIDLADTDLAAEFWSKSPEVSFIHPRGHERGWEEVKRNFYEQTMGARFSERTLTLRDVVVHVYGDVAWAEFHWDFLARFKENGAPLRTKGRETQVFRKTDGHWELVHVHYSGMPVTGKREGF